MGVQDEEKKETDDEESSLSRRFTLWTHRPLHGKLPVSVALKDVTAQEDDRMLINSLLEQSEEDEGLIGTLFCGDWRDAVTGWSLARPNVKYAWVEKSGKNRKNRNVAKKQKREEVEQSWKNKIEPGTYKYNPGCQHQPLNAIPAKRQVHPSLQVHIDKVREHLERTLMKQSRSEGLHENCKRLDPLPSIVTRNKVGASGDEASIAPSVAGSINDYTHGQYVVKMTPKGRRHSIEGDNLIYKSEGGGDTKGYFHRNGLGRQSDTKLLKLNKMENRHQHQDVQAKETSNTIDLVTALGQKLNEILMEDRLKSLGTIRAIPISRKIQKSSLISSATSSFECFQTSECAPSHNELPLNPLTKITPHQRQIHDDHEVSAITSSEPDNSSKGSFLLSNSSDVSKQETSSKDFFHVGISGQGMVESSKSDKSNQCRNSESSPLSSGKKNRLSGSNKFHKLPLTHGKRDSCEKTGDDRHKGVMDRETAAGVAVSLIPGVSGHKIEVPNG